MRTHSSAFDEDLAEGFQLEISLTDLDNDFDTTEGDSECESDGASLDAELEEQDEEGSPYASIANPIRQYLSQIYRFPILTRAQERKAAKEIERTRDEYRHSGFANDYILDGALELSERVSLKNGNPKKLSSHLVHEHGTKQKDKKKEIERISNCHRKTLKNLLDRNRTDYVIAISRKNNDRIKDEAWKRIDIRRDKAFHLMQELNIRDTALENLFDEFRFIADRMEELRKELDKPASAKRNSRPVEDIQYELNNLMNATLETPQTANRRLESTVDRKEKYEKAMKALWQSNLRWSYTIAKKFRKRGLSLQDLIQEGNSGLRRAAEKFDFRRGYKFSTYSTHWIKQAIRHAIGEIGLAIRLPQHVRDTNLHSTEGQLMVEHGRNVTIEEVAKAAGVDLATAQGINAAHASAKLSLNRTIGGDSTSEFESLHEDEIHQDPGALLMERERNIPIQRAGEKAFRTLNSRTREVLRLRMGFVDGREWSKTEVGERFKFTGERVRQIEMKGIKMLQRPDIAELILLEKRGANTEGLWEKYWLVEANGVTVLTKPHILEEYEIGRGPHLHKLVENVKHQMGYESSDSTAVVECFDAIDVARYCAKNGISRRVDAEPEQKKPILQVGDKALKEEAEDSSPRISLTELLNIEGVSKALIKKWHKHGLRVTGGKNAEYAAKDVIALLIQLLVKSETSISGTTLSNDETDDEKSTETVLPCVLAMLDYKGDRQPVRDSRIIAEVSVAQD